jgi:phosphotransferase system IIB component
MFDKALAGLKHIGQVLLKAPAAGHEDAAPEHAAAPLQGADLAKTQTAEALALRHTADAIWASLGGQANVRSWEAVAGTRLRVELEDPTQFNPQQAQLAGVLAVAQVSTQLMHLIVGPQAPLLAADWRAQWRVP